MLVLPYKKAAAVTKSDSTVLPATRGLYVGGAGNINVVMAGDSVAQVLLAVPAGTTLPISVTKVMSASTSATSIVALY